MALVDKLSALKAKLWTKFGKQESTITFRKETVTNAANFGRPYNSSPDTDVSITTGAKVSRAKAYQVDSGGTIQIDDVMFYIPQHLLTEAQITDTKSHGFIIYNSKNYSLITYSPTSVLNGEPLAWKIVARVKN